MPRFSGTRTAGLGLTQPWVDVGMIHRSNIPQHHVNHTDPRMGQHILHRAILPSYDART